MTAVIDIALGTWVGRALGKQQSHSMLKEKDMGSGTRCVARREAAVVLTCREGSEATDKAGSSHKPVSNAVGPR